MAENKISYVARNYDDYKREIKELTRKYYPDVFASLNDASIGEWLIELISDIGDNLSFHTDRVFQETNIDSANQMSSLNSLARTNGLKIPGQKAAIVEVELSCEIPVNGNGQTNGSLSTPDETYLPFIKRGTLFSNGIVTFELDEDVDFKDAFNRDGINVRKMYPNRTSNGNIESYTYTKLAIAVAAQSKIYKMVVQNSDIEPFMSITLPDKNILGVESILVRQGENITADPSLSEFYVDEEMYYDYSGKPVQRYFEVENLIDQFRFGYAVEKLVDGSSNSNNDKTNFRQYYNPYWYVDGNIVTTNEDGTTSYEPIRKVAKGQWKRLKNKFITEYTDDFKLKITFGAGIRNKYGEIPNDASLFTQYMMSRMYANDYMGVLPEAHTTLYVLYKVGGGEISNIAANTLTNIISIDFNIDGNDAAKRRAVKDSIRVTNPTISYGGKDMPNASELRHLIKYNNGAQNRCVTINDYYAILNEMPGKFGLPFRMGIVEENNKIAIYTLGLDYEGHLTNLLSETVAQNMKDYLSMYKMINDFVEIKSGKIINVAFDVTIYVDKTYDRAEVVQRVINKIAEYMDVRTQQMGEEIYLGDLQKEITKLDGVVQIVNMVVKNKVGDGYSEDETTQELIDPEKLSLYGNTQGDEDSGNIIDLEASDYILFSDVNSMHEIKSKESDINIITRVR